MTDRASRHLGLHATELGQRSALASGLSALRWGGAEVDSASGPSVLRASGAQPAWLSALRTHSQVGKASA
eukprot:12143317-Alexandrium_andersonii.AAC.1